MKHVSGILNRPTEPEIAAKRLEVAADHIETRHAKETGSCTHQPFRAPSTFLTPWVLYP